MTRAACTTSGASSFSDLPIKIDERRNGVASTRSYEPRVISNSRLDPATPVPNRQIITITPGRNHCNGLAPPIAAGSIEPASSVPNNARKTSGWTREKITENGSRRTSIISRWKTAKVSDNTLPREPERAPEPGSGWRLRSSCRHLRFLAQAPPGQAQEDIIQRGHLDIGGDHRHSRLVEFAQQARQRPRPLLEMTDQLHPVRPRRNA